MIVALDTSILVAAVVATEAYHSACNRVLDQSGNTMYSHGLTEAFSTLTGGRRNFRLGASLVASILKEDYLPQISITSLTPNELLKAMAEAEGRGVRGGAIFDFLHLMAARKGKAAKFYTLNTAHFLAFHRPDDPQIVHP